MENEKRIIVLYDCDTNFLVETNAPSEEIENAISFKNELLEINSVLESENEKTVPFSSDFEEMQSFLNNKGYYFEQIGYVNDLESYNW